MTVFFPSEFQFVFCCSFQCKFQCFGVHYLGRFKLTFRQTLHSILPVGVSIAEGLISCLLLLYIYASSLGFLHNNSDYAYMGFTSTNTKKVHYITIETAVDFTNTLHAADVFPVGCPFKEF